MSDDVNQQQSVHHLATDDNEKDSDSLERRQGYPPDDRRYSQSEAHLTEVAAAPPIDRQHTRRSSLEQDQLKARRQSPRSSHRYGNEGSLTEVAEGPPVDRTSDEEGAIETQHRGSSDETNGGVEEKSAPHKTHSQEVRSHLATEIYIHAYLIVFAIFGVLARLGVEAITFYPGAPVVTKVLWANFGGSLFFGFLSEDQRLFREEWGTPSDSSFSNLSDNQIQPDEAAAAREAAKKKHGTIKKSIPLYIGLSTGFCGSFTSFSSFIRDAFLALSNDLTSPGISSTTQTTIHRHAGYSFEALLAVLITEICLSLSALSIGAHLAILLDRFTPTLPFHFFRRFLDPTIIFLAFGCWLGAVFLTVWPPNASTWRGRAVFAVVFAPLGCLLRFYASRYLNARIPSFPLGTFSVNIFGTMILGMCYDLQHSSVTAVSATSAGSIIGCQVLDGVMEGFCGATTTVSTWVAELNGLRRRHAYVYGGVSVVAGIASLVVIMGSLRWTKGFETIACKT